MQVWPLRLALLSRLDCGEQTSVHAEMACRGALIKGFIVS